MFVTHNRQFTGTTNEGKYMRKKRLLALLMCATMILQPMSYTTAAEVEGDLEQNSSETISEYQEQVEELPDSDEADDSVLEIDENSTIQEDNSDTTSVSEQHLPEEIAVTGGYISSALDDNTPAYYENGIATQEAIPSSYQADIAAVREKYPPVRSQGAYGTCWAFSTMGLAEFDLINKGVYDKNVDFSELQLVYHTFNYVEDPLGGTAGDVSKYYNDRTKNNYLNRGGTYLYAARRLGQWISITDESVLPYSEAENVSTKGLDSSYAYSNNKAHLENVYRINIRQNTDDVKKQIMKHGAVGVNYTRYYLGENYVTNTYNDVANMTALSGDGGHAVMIIGWDDNFDKSKFNQAYQPSKNGAWLVRNSWGSGSNNFDYFWMSYETNSLNDAAWVMDFSVDDGFDNNYQLDGGLDTYTSNSTTVANVFTVKSKEGVNSELLKAVSLSFNSVTNVGYTIEIYTDLMGSSRPTSGTRHEEATTTGTTTYAGTYTIPLEKPVKLEEGTTFSVVVTVDKPGLDCEEGYSEESTEDENIIAWENYVSKFNSKSYFRTEAGGYSQNSNNFCIKAFTSNVTEQQTHTINYELCGGENAEENPTSYVTGEVIALKDPTRDGCKFEGWYLESDYQTQITEIPVDAAGDYTLYAKWSSATGEVSHSYTLNLDGTIAINLYMELPENLVSNQEAYMEFTLPNGSVSQVKVKDTVEKDGYYIFTCRVAAKEMASDVKARMVADGQRGKEYTVSVQRYADYVLNHTNEYSATTVKLVKAMLNYGASAQTMFNYHTDKMANEILSEEDKKVDTIDFSAYKHVLITDSNEKGISCYVGSLCLESDTSIKDYFILNDNVNIDEYTFYGITNGGAPVQLEPQKTTLNGKECYAVEIKNIKAQNLDQSVVVTVQKKENPDVNVIKLQFNAFSYAYAMANMTSPNQKTVDVTNAMYAYWQLAKQYVDEKTNQ